MTAITVRNILVGIDFGSASLVALRYGVELADELGATLHVVHVASHTDKHLDGAVPALRRLTPPSAHVLMLEADGPARALLDYARAHGIDLIVAGTESGRPASPWRAYFMGSVAQNLVRNAPCPVLTMRAPVDAAA